MVEALVGFCGFRFSEVGGALILVMPELGFVWFCDREGLYFLGVWLCGLAWVVAPAA